MTPKKIKMIRTYMGLDQHQFGNLFGLTNKMVSRWEQPIESKSHYPIPTIHEERLDRIFSKYKEIHGEIEW